MSYIILDKYPLFRYFRKGSDMHVLCFGSGIFVDRMILSMLSTGQMIGRKLFIHVVSADADAYKQRLKETAPALDKYANLGDNDVLEENNYVTFTFETIDDLTKESTCHEIAEKYGELCRYVIVSLGANNSNITFAQRFAFEIGKVSREKTIINYYTAADCVANSRTDVIENTIPRHVKVMPFGNHFASYGKDVHALGMKAFRVHYLYEKLYSKSVGKEAALRSFMADEYKMRSSLASAVHIDYKLASIGINTADPQKMKKSRNYVAEYQRKIICKYYELVLPLHDQTLSSSEQKSSGTKTENYNKLLQLEHRRWMMYMIADGFRRATDEDHKRYSFRYVNGKFNNAFKCTDKNIKTHHCLVPSGENGIMLSRNHDEWDKYTTVEQINATEYDALDKASLIAHLIAKKRITSLDTHGKIKSIVYYELHERLGYYTGDKKSVLVSSYEEFKKWVDKVLTHQNPDKLDVKLKSLQNQFSLFDVDISDIIEKLRNEFAIFVEYQKYNDYKVPDQTIIENLMWVKFDNDVIMLKTTGDSVISNILSPLIMEPKKLVLLGKEEPPHISSFFANHGNNIQVFFEQCDCSSVQDTVTVLKQIIQQSPLDNYVIDVTAAHPFWVIAATRLAAENKNVGVIYCDPRNSYNNDDVYITNIANYPYAPVHRLKSVSISANEVFELYGTKEKAEEDSYMLGLSDYMNDLWKFYLNHSHEWEMISSFFEAFGRGSSEFHISDLSITDAHWSLYNRQVSFDTCEKTGIFNVFHKLEDHGIIKEFACERTEAYTTISFMYPVTDPNNNADLFSKKLSNLFNSLGDAELTCTIKSKSENVFDIDILTGLKVFRNFKETGKFSNNDKQNPKEFLIADMETVFKELKDRQLISFLEFRPNPDGGSYISFIYNSSAIRDCLTTAGNILEAYVWHEADKTGYFDSLKANYSFTWANSNVSNELDVILTKGLTTLVCSCKTAKMAKEHLYEVAELAHRFSVNAKPVIIYSSDKSVENGKISVNIESVKERAKAMGIYLIDKDMLNGGLGAELVRICQGERYSETI